MDQGADDLNAQPDAAELTVVTIVRTSALAYLFVGTTGAAHLKPGAAAQPQWASSDFSVLYANPVRRNLIQPALVDHLAGLTPVLVVRLEGLEYASLYDVRDAAGSSCLLPGTASAPDQGLSAADGR